jgi:glycerol-3-phosphate acyltransferase PlsY
MIAFVLALEIYHAPRADVIYAGVVGALSAMAGHTYPVWLRFQGGKGIATAAGIMLALFPPQVFAFGLLVWVVLFYSTRFVSVASSELLSHFPRALRPCGRLGMAIRCAPASPA